MQARTLNLIVFFSVLLLTLACGATAVWLVLQNPKLADKLFYTVLGLFTMGASGIIGLIRAQGLHRQAVEIPLPGPAAPPIGGRKRECAPHRERLDSELHKATSALPKPLKGALSHVGSLADREGAGKVRGEENPGLGPRSASARL
jgi:hypothetical protein